MTGFVGARKSSVVANQTMVGFNNTTAFEEAQGTKGSAGFGSGISKDGTSDALRAK